MTTIKTKDGTEIYYKDWGTGRPVTFSHGWPLNADAWDDQMFFWRHAAFGASRMIGAATADPASHGMETTSTPMPMISRRWWKRLISKAQS